MMTFEVNDMTCGHCVSAITQALKAADKDARVQVDLARHGVRVETASAAAADVRAPQRGCCCGGKGAPVARS